MGVILFLLEAEVWAISASSFYISIKCRLAFFTRRLFIIFTSLNESCAFFMRAALALALDRGALSNVIFQKQGEIAASLLPAAVTGYSFLFPADRDLNKSHELRGGLSDPSLTLAAEGGNTMQLAAQRLALNLREAGFNLQVVGMSSQQHIDLTLRRLTLESTQAQAALESIERQAGVTAPVVESTPAGLYRVEREFLDAHTLIPLLYLPRAYAVGGRVRELRLNPNGTPQLAGVSLEDAP